MSGIFGRKDPSVIFSQGPASGDGDRPKGLIGRGPLGVFGSVLAGVAGPTMWDIYGEQSLIPFTHTAQAFSHGVFGMGEAFGLAALSMHVVGTMVRRADEIAKSHTSDGAFANRTSLMASAAKDSFKIAFAVGLSAVAISYADDQNMIKPPLSSDGFVHTSIRLAHALNPFDKHRARSSNEPAPPMYPSIVTRGAAVYDGSKGYPWTSLQSGDEICVTQKVNPGVDGNQVTFMTSHGPRYVLGEYKGYFKPNRNGTVCDAYADPSRSNIKKPVGQLNPDPS